MLNNKDQEQALSAINALNFITNNPTAIATLATEVKDELEFNGIEFVNVTVGRFKVLVTFKCNYAAGYASSLLSIERGYDASHIQNTMYVSPTFN